MRLRNLFNAESDAIFSAALMIGFFSFLSKGLGVLRNRIFAGEFGAGDTMDVYFAAFLIPDFLYNLFIIGILSSVFIPIFAEYLTRNKEEAWRLASVVITLCIAALAVFAAVAAIFAPWIVTLIAPGFTPEKHAQTAALMRIMFLSPILLGTSNIIGNILQVHKRFFSFALAPVMYNIGIILAALFLIKPFGITGLAIGVVLGALLHLLIQLPSITQLGFSFRPIFDIGHPGLRKIVWLSLPRAVGIAAQQVNFIVITAIASTVVSGSVAIFYFANDLQFVPIGIIAFSFIGAVFPFLASSYAQRDMDAFLDKLYGAVNQILFFVIPVSLFLILMRAQLVRVFLGYGQFSWEDTRLTAACVGAFALSIFAQSLVPLFARAFYALQDTKTPVIISVVSVLGNIGFSFYFLSLMKAQGAFAHTVATVFKVSDLSGIEILALPLAFSLTSVLNLMLLYFAFLRKVESFDGGKVIPPLFKINLAAFVMALAVYPTLRFIGDRVDMHTFMGVFIQGALAFIVGSAVYMGVTYLLKVSEFFAIWHACTLPIRRIFLSRIFPIVNDHE